MATKKKSKPIPKTLVTKKYVAKSLRELLLVGQLLSNWAHNTKQNRKLSQKIRNRIGFWQKKWDSRKRDLPDWMKK